MRSTAWLHVGVDCWIDSIGGGSGNQDNEIASGECVTSATAKSKVRHDRKDLLNQITSSNLQLREVLWSAPRKLLRRCKSIYFRLRKQSSSRS